MSLATYAQCCGQLGMFKKCSLKVFPTISLMRDEQFDSLKESDLGYREGRHEVTSPIPAISDQ